MNLTYGDIAFVVWVVLFSLLSLLCLAAQFVIKGMAKRSIRDASHSIDDYSEVASTIKLSLWVRVVRIIVVWGCPLFFSLALMALSMYDLIPWYADALIICFALFAYWSIASSFFPLLFTVCCSGSRPAKKEFYESLLDGDELQDDGPIKESRQYNARATLFSLSIRQGTPLLVGFILIFGICWFFSSVCIAFEPVELSFKGMRDITSEVCDEKLRPCHVYLNVADNSSSTMIVVFHTNYKMSTPRVRAGPTSQSSPLDYPVIYDAVGIQMDIEVRRYVYVVYMNFLDPHRTYYFVAGDGEVPESYSQERKFRTTDSHMNNHPLHFVSAGDVGVTKLTEKMLGLAASKEPSFMIFGGDLSYSNGMRTCYRRWDRWLRLYSEKAVTPSGYSVPLLTTIGNHEAGGFRMKFKNAAFYPFYFYHQPIELSADAIKSGYQTKLLESQQETRGSLKVKQSTMLVQKTYHAHDVAGSQIIALDSDVLTRPEGEQQDFIRNTLNNTRNGHSYVHSSLGGLGGRGKLSANHPKPWAMAVYHMPMYPSVRSYDDTYSKGLRKAWVPLFDEYHLDIAFENHDHAYKRTYPLYNGKTVANAQLGTTYLGDGSLGVPPRKPAQLHKRDYLVEAERENFFFFMTLTPRNVTISAINDRGVEFDYHVIAQ